MANMRKVIQKNRDAKQEIVSNSSSTIKVSLIMGVIFIVLAYGVSALIYHFNKKPVVIDEVKQYSINSSVVFDMSDDEYYVILYDKKGTDAIVLNSLVDNYRKKNKTPIYEVDLSKSYNSSVISSTPNINANDSSQLKIANSTLIKIKEGKNVGYYESVLVIEKELEN